MVRFRDIQAHGIFSSCCRPPAFTTTPVLKVCKVYSERRGIPSLHPLRPHQMKNRINMKTFNTKMQTNGKSNIHTVMCSPYAPASCGIPDARGISKKRNKKSEVMLAKVCCSSGSRSFSHAGWDLRTYEPIKKARRWKPSLPQESWTDFFFPFCLLANLGKQSDTPRWRLSTEELRSHPVTGKEQKKKRKKKPFCDSYHGAEIFAWVTFTRVVCFTLGKKKNSDWNCSFSCVLVLLYSVSLWADWNPN